MSAPLPLRIFLASPSDVPNEREIVKACVEEYNRAHADGGVSFELVGGERVRGTAQRPQEAINELIAESHFLIALFKKAWGSESGSRWGYTSGTEEELFIGLLGLGNSEHLMRDVWVGFVQDSNPSPEITGLKTQFSSTHSMMYEAVSDARALKDKLGQRLEGWGASFGAKVPRRIDLLPSSGRDVLRAANARWHGEQLVDLGQFEAGRLSLREAAGIGGPDEHLAYARFLARHGDLDDAYQETQLAIDEFNSAALPLNSPSAAEAFAAQAGVLRRQGRAVDSVGRLEQALRLIVETDPYSERVRCRILDELGLAQQNLGEVDQSRQKFEESLQSRRTRDSNVEVCQSLINLARLEVAAENLARAEALVREILDGLEETTPTALRANAEVLAAQVLLRLNRPDEAIPHAVRSLAVNQQIGSKNGEAIAQLLLAQCYRAAGSIDDAIIHATASLDLNREMGNSRGAARAQWQLDELAGRPN